MTGMEQTQPTIAELLARIEELEKRLTRRRGPRRLPGRVGIMLGLVLTLAFGPTFASLAGAASPVSSFWAFTGNSITTGQFLGTTNTQPLVLKTNSITALTIGAGSGSTPGNVAVAGKLNAAGGLQENGTDLSSKYALVGGGNATGTWGVNTTGNAGSVTHRVYDNGSYSDPAWLASLAGSKINGNIGGNAAGFTGSLSGDVTGGQSSTTVGALQGHAVDSTAPLDGQVLKWDASSSKWAPGTDNTGLTAVSTDGTTLTGNGTGGSPLAVNTSGLQARVTGSCSFLGSSISVVKADGTVSCQSPPPVLCPNCNLFEVNLADANMVSAWLPGANMTEGDLENADLSYANLGQAILTNAAMTNANLSNAFLHLADLTGAILSNANLHNADLNGANLNGALGTETAIITGVIWFNTICPDGSNSSTNGTSPQSCVGHGF
jgi:hypothetical protein